MAPKKGNGNVEIHRSEGKSDWELLGSNVCVRLPVHVSVCEVGGGAGGLLLDTYYRGVK